MAENFFSGSIKGLFRFIFLIIKYILLIIRYMIVRKKGRIILVFLMIVTGIGYWFYGKFKPEDRLKIQREELKQKPYDLGYGKIVEDNVFENLNLPGTVENVGVTGSTEQEKMLGMAVRTYRFMTISRKVEIKYNLPKHLILAMIMQETGGADILPNSSDDGGIGLCHMQPATAKDFGLKTYKDCDKLICTEHGKQLRNLITKYNKERMDLIPYDDRFHPILNLDAVGRMLAFHKTGWQIKDTPIKTAICRYSGTKKFDRYYKNVEYYRSKLNDPKFFKEVEKDFNARNPRFKIGNKKGDFKGFLKENYRRLKNYGIENYGK